MSEELPLPNINFTVADRGGEYFTKLQALSAAVNAAINAVNGVSNVTGAITDLGAEFVTMLTPEGVRFVSVNDDGTVSLLTANQFLNAIGASDGMANPMAVAGALVVGGTDGTPTELEPGADGQSLQMVDGLPAWEDPAETGISDAPSDGKTHGRKDGSWVEVGAGGGGISTAALQTFSSADQVSNNITATCDCTTDNHHPLDFNGTPTPSTAGTYTINLTNLPVATTELVVGHIEVKRAGRKTGVTIQAGGFTVAWLATPSYQSAAAGIDIIQYMINPLTPTVLRLSQVYSRST